MSVGSKRWGGKQSGTEKDIQLMSQWIAALRCRYGTVVHDLHEMPAFKSGVQDRVQFQKSGKAEQERGDGARNRGAQTAARPPTGINIYRWTCDQGFTEQFC